MNGDGEFKYKFGDLNRIVDEKGNQFIAMRTIQWGVGQDEENNEKQFVFDIRKYRTQPNGEERMAKGVSFLTPEGPNQLVHAMLEEGYGDTTECLKVLKDRENFKDAIIFISEGEPDTSEYFDPRKLLDL